MRQDTNFSYVGEGQSTGHPVIMRDAFRADTRWFFDQQLPCFLA